MGNIGSEVARFLTLLDKQRSEEAKNSLARACELLDMTIEGQILSARKKELEQIKTELAFMLNNNSDRTLPEHLNNYFLPYAVLARKNMGRL